MVDAASGMSTGSIGTTGASTDQTSGPLTQDWTEKDSNSAFSQIERTMDEIERTPGPQQEIRE
jgi:hypothetical protein